MAARSTPRPVPDAADDVGADSAADSAAEGLDRGMEHLQTAAHEMIAAARSFLDVVEDVVSDREKLRGVADAVTDLVASAGGSLAKVADRVAHSAPGHAAGDETPTAPRVRRIHVE